MIVIVGAGLAGLVCARELARRGVGDFLLLEAEDEPGGRVRSLLTPEGFVLDRGFQVLLDSYPAVRRQLDLAALHPRYLESGAVLHARGETWTMADPRRHPLDLPESLLGSAFPFADKLRLVRLVAELLITPDDVLLAGTASDRDTSTAHFLWLRGFSPAITERFLRPFFGGVFLDDQLGTSAALFRYYLKKFATGRALLPARGIGEIPRQLAAGLPGAGCVWAAASSVSNSSARAPTRSSRAPASGSDSTRCCSPRTPRPPPGCSNARRPRCRPSAPRWSTSLPRRRSTHAPCSRCPPAAAGWCATSCS